MFVTIRNYTAFFGVTCAISLSFMWPIITVAQNYNLLAEERLGRHIGTIIFDQFFYQGSTVLLGTFISIAPIYIFKFAKMRLLFPQFFPLNQSTCNSWESQLWPRTVKIQLKWSTYLNYFIKFNSNKNKNLLGFWGFGVLGFWGVDDL